MNLPEILLWQCLRRRSLGLKFRKQHPLPPYVLDFYCPEARLVVEVDGQAHDRGNRPARDASREVLASPETVAEAIVASVGKPLHRPAGGPPPHALHGEDRSGAY